MQRFGERREVCKMEEFDKTFKRMQYIAILWILVVLGLGAFALFILAKWLKVI